MFTARDIDICQGLQQDILIFVNVYIRRFNICQTTGAFNICQKAGVFNICQTAGAFERNRQGLLLEAAFSLIGVFSVLDLNRRVN